jgi:small subunit ribosomal protein S17
MTPKKPKKTLIGKVVSDKMRQSRLVRIDSLVKHPRYGKFRVRSSKIMAHDANNQTKIGDKVLIQECRPLSKRKSWFVKKIISEASAVETAGVSET